MNKRIIKCIWKICIIIFLVLASTFKIKAATLLLFIFTPASILVQLVLVLILTDPKNKNFGQTFKELSMGALMFNLTVYIVQLGDPSVLPIESTLILSISTIAILALGLVFK